MADAQYPTHIGSILDKPVFLVTVDRIVDMVVENTPDDETRLAELMLQLTDLCLNQAKLIVKSAYPADMTLQDRFYRILKAADDRWDITRKYLQDTRNIEAHPLAMISIIRGAVMQTPGNQKEMDHIILGAIDQYAESLSDEVKELMGWREEDLAKPVELPSVKNDPELLMKFFTQFKKVKDVHRKRSDYVTDEQRQAYDELMAIFNAIIE